MNSLTAFSLPLSETVIERLGWVLVHSLWQLALVALLAGAIARGLRRQSAAARYVVLVFAMAVAVGAPVATWMLLPDYAPGSMAGRQRPDALERGMHSAELRRADAAPFASGGAILEGDADDERSRSNVPDADNAGIARSSIPAGKSPRLTWTESIALALRPWLAWIVAAWSAGVVVCSLRPLLGWRTLRRLRRIGVSPAAIEVEAALRRISARLGIRRAVQVMHSTLAQAPLVVGYLRPVVLLPVSLATSIPASQLEAILAHELAHVLRHDFVVNLLQTLVETVFFYHPAVWWLSRQIRIEREHCCDDLVVALLDNRVEYGRALIAIDELRARTAVLALGAGDGSLLARIRRIVGVRPDGSAGGLRERSPAALLSLACLGLAIVLSLSWKLAAKDEEKPEPPPIAKLSGDITVELIGVGFHPSRDREWWKADGSQLEQRPELQAGKSVIPNSPEQANCREFYIQIRGLPPEHSVATDYGPVSSASSSAYQDGLWIGEHAAGPFKSETALIRIGITTDEFGPLVSIDRDGKKAAYPDLSREMKLLYDRVVPLRVEESDGNTELILQSSPINELGKLAAWEIFAVDREGKLHRVSSNQAPPSDEKYYGFKIPHASIARFEYRLRPYRHWVTFENVSLQPGRKSRASVKTESLPEPVKLRIKNADGSTVLFNNVVEAHVGFPKAPLPRWVSWRRKDGLVPLDTLPEGTHWLLAAGNAQNRTLFQVKLPAQPPLIERNLRAAQAWTAQNIDIKTAARNDDKVGDLIVVEIANRTRETLHASEEDVQLNTENGREMIRGLSPRWQTADREPFPRITIEPGQTGRLTLNWADWVRQGLWSSRSYEDISEPGLPEPVPGKLWVRVGLGNHFTLPVSVTDPAEILAAAQQKPPAAKFPPPARDVTRGLDLSEVAVRGAVGAESHVPDLFAPDPAHPGSWIQPRNVFQMPLAEHTWLKYPTGRGHFYIEHRPDGTWQNEQIYGPIAGDPFDVLKLDELFRENLVSRVAAGDPTYRLRLMFRTGNPGLIRRAWRLIEPLLGKDLPDRNEGLFGRTELLLVVREALRDETAAFRNPELQDLTARIRQVVAETEAAIDALNDSLPDESYQSVTYRQEKLAAKIPEALWGKPLNGLRLALVPRDWAPGMDWNELPLGAPLPASVAVQPGGELQYQLVVENVSGDEIKMCGYLIGEEIARTLEVFDRNGKPVEIRHLHTTIPRFHSYWRLKPGERELLSLPAVHFTPAGEDEANRGLGYFVKGVPGEYTLRCSVRFGDLDNTRHRYVPGKSEWIGQLTTGTQKITVGGPAPETPKAVERVRQPESDDEKAVTKLELVFFKDQSRRTLPGVVVKLGEETFVLTTGPATVVPDGTPHAIDRILVDVGGESPVEAQYDSRGTAELVAHRVGRAAIPHWAPAAVSVAVGDALSVIREHKPNGWRIDTAAAKVIALDSKADLQLLDRNIHHKFAELIEVDHALAEGTPLFKQGRLAGIILLGSRFIGEEAGRSYAVPADRIAALCDKLKLKVETVQAKGLAFLASYPKLHGLSLKMNEEEFLAIVARENLKLRKTAAGGGTHYSIPTGDGHTVIVMFGNNGDKCSGIQRIRGEDAPLPVVEPVADQTDETAVLDAPKKAGPPAFVLPDHLNVMAVGFDRDSRNLVSVAIEKEISIRTWDVGERKLKGEVKLATDLHYNRYLNGGLMLSADRTRVLATGDDQVGIWETATGRLVKTLDLPKDLQHGLIQGLDCTPDLKLIAGGRTPGLSGLWPDFAHAVVWDVASGKVLQTVKHEGVIQMKSVALSPDGKWLATGGQQAGTCVWEVATGKLLYALPNDNPNRRHPNPEVTPTGANQVLCLRFSPDNRQLAIGDMLGVKLVEARSGKLVHSFDVAFRFGRSGLVFSHDGRLLARVATDKVVPIWSTETGKLVAELPTEAHDGSFSADGQWFAAGFSDQKQALAVWRLRDRAAAGVPAAPAAQNREATGRGVLKGRFVFDGPPPARKDLHPGLSNLEANSPTPTDGTGRVLGVAMTYQEYLRQKIRPDTHDPSLIVGNDGGIANVLVWVASKDIPWKPPAEAELRPATIRLKNGNYEPRMSVLIPGQPLRVENHDPLGFNFHADFVRNNSVNMLLRPQTVENPQRFSFPRIESVPTSYRSDQGIWATGWLFVHANSFVAVSGDDGSFAIPDLPPGEWEFRVWHERQGFLKNWPKGLFKHTIQPGENDLGTFRLNPENFTEKGKTPATR